MLETRLQKGYHIFIKGRQYATFTKEDKASLKGHQIAYFIHVMPCKRDALKKKEKQEKQTRKSRSGYDN